MFARPPEKHSDKTQERRATANRQHIHGSREQRHQSWGEPFDKQTAVRRRTSARRPDDQIFGVYTRRSDNQLRVHQRRRKARVRQVPDSNGSRQRDVERLPDDLELLR